MILIVDDTPANILALEKTLEADGMTCDAAYSGEEALKKILKKEYSLIILDVQMPGMDGFEVAEILAGNSRTRNIPIIFLSAVSLDKKFIEKGYASGGADYITKPFDPDLLLLRIRTFLKLSEHHMALEAMGTELAEENRMRKQVQENLELLVAERTAELVKKNETLELANNELQQFAWVVSHDLKEPLRKIQMFNRILSESHLQDDPKGFDLANRAVGASNRMEHLIMDLLDFSRLSAALNWELTDLNSIVLDTLDIFDEVIRNLHAEINIAQLPSIEANGNQLRQVFQNLIGNSLKFATPGVSPKLDILCEFTAEKSVTSPALEKGPYCRITVRDNGIGFDERFLEKIFIIFQRLHDRNNYEGTGIGLSIAKKIMERHGGLISARSCIGKGSDFILVFPMVQS